MEHKHALIAMSGGVDSGAAAYLTMQAGLRTSGAIMRLYKGSGEQDIEDARSVAGKLGIDFYVLDLQDAFHREVIGRFISCYEQGLTPNPCVDCNKHLKFDRFLAEAERLGCDCIATGHYARIRYDEASGRYLLYKAADESKDQSYVLYSLNQYQLGRTRLPLGELTKAEARQIAESQGFVNARKKDSQDICFVPDGDYVEFLEKYLNKQYAPGDFLDESGNVVGKHRGAIAYTLGQRKGLGLAMGAPVYVCGKDMAANTVTVGPNEALFSKGLRAKDWNFIPFPALKEPLRVQAKARYRHTAQPATVYPEENGYCRVEFDEPQRAITPGQAIVLYQGDLVIGGGTITEVLE